MSVEAIFTDIERHTPKEGFNLVGIDDFEQFGEQLYFISHHKTRAEAEEALARRRKEHPNEELIIYPIVEERTAASNDECVWRTINGHPVCIKHSDRPVSYDDAKESYEKIESSKESFSYDPAHKKAYDFSDRKDAKEFYQRYSKDDKPVYVVAVTNNTTGKLNDVTEKAYNRIKETGRQPLIGKWTAPDGRVFTDVGFPVSRIDDAGARSLLRTYKQEAAVKVYSDGTAELIYIE